MSQSTYFDQKMETMPLDQLLAWQSQQVADVVAHAYEHASGFRRIMDDAGLTPADVQSVDDLVKIPIMSKDRFIELQQADPPFGGFLCRPVDELKRIFVSPGPLFDPEGPEPDYWRMAPALYSIGLRPDDIILNTASYHMTPLGIMFDEAVQMIGATVVPGGVGNTEMQIGIMRAVGVTGYAGLPSFLMTIIERAEAMGINWQRDMRLNKAFVAAEPFPQHLRDEFERRGITVRQGYGTAELGNLGFECDAIDGWHIPYDAVLQVVDINTGEPLGHGQEGEVVVTLFNKTYAMIRFSTGDLSALNMTPCSCGRTTPRLVGWLGRSGQAVKVRGMFVHPRQLAMALQQFPSISRYQALVTREGNRDELTVRVEFHGEGADTATLAEALQQAVKVKAVVEPVSAGTIPADAQPLQDLRTWE
jgi:phenylacetate-CoA ligase